MSPDRTRGATATDAVRRLPLPADPTDADDVGRLRRDALLERVLATDPTADVAQDRAPGTGRRGRRVAAVAGTVAALMATGGALAAAGVFSPAQVYSGCLIQGGEDGGVPEPVGDARQLDSDPVRGCAAEWLAFHGTTPPAMDVYLDGDGRVAVVPRGWTVPDGLSPATTDVAVDTRVAQLEFALEDDVDGLGRDCYDGGAARGIAERELARLGLDDWSVSVSDDDWTGLCAGATLDPEARVVALGPATYPEDHEPFPRVLALGDAVNGQCLDLADAGATAVELLAEDVAIGGLHLVEVPDDALACTTVDVVVGGMLSVTLRGPGAPSGLAPAGPPEEVVPPDGSPEGPVEGDVPEGWEGSEDGDGFENGDAALLGPDGEILEP